MSRLMPIAEPSITINFKCKLKKQPYLIDALLRYSHLSLANLAELLQVPLEELTNIQQGIDFLNQAQGIELARLFFIFFAE